MSILRSDHILITLFVDTGILSIAVVVGGIEKISKMESRSRSSAENVTFQVRGSVAADIDIDIGIEKISMMTSRPSSSSAENVTFQVSGSGAADRSSSAGIT